MRRFFGPVVATCGFFAMSGVAVAQPPQWQPFGDGHWQAGTGNAGADKQNWGFVTTSNGSGTYGGLQLRSAPQHLSDYPDGSSFSFDYKSNVDGSSGGSPRMVVQFSDGGSGQLGPTALDNSGYHHETGTNSDWNNTGGCGYRYGTSWDEVKNCHPNATVTGISVVNDSGWAYPSGETITLDNVKASNADATGPGSH